MKSLDLTVLFLLRDDEVLLAMKKRGFGKDNWNGVGGKVDPGETLDQALVREAQEEIGITPVDYRKVGYLVFNEIHNAERKMMHINVYTATEWTGEITESDEMRPKWFNKTEIPYDHMWADDPHWLPRILNGELITGEFTMTEDNKVEKFSVRQANSVD